MNKNYATDIRRCINFIQLSVSFSKKQCSPHNIYNNFKQIKFWHAVCYREGKATFSPSERRAAPFYRECARPAADAGGAAPIQLRPYALRIFRFPLFGKWPTASRQGSVGMKVPDTRDFQDIYKGNQAPSNAFSIQSSPSRERRRKADVPPVLLRRDVFYDPLKRFCFENTPKKFRRLSGGRPLSALLIRNALHAQKLYAGTGDSGRQIPSRTARAPKNNGDRGISRDPRTV